jgi:threonine aldolase
MDPAALEALLGRQASPSPHWVQPAVLSLTQPTERGTCYRFEELDALVAIAKRHGLKVHMDGARLANAICSMGGSPADHSWRRGVDVLSLGATKSGALAAEAVVFFAPKAGSSAREPALDEGFAWRRKRAGHLVSKMRFVSAQLKAWLEGDRWRDLAGHANRMAQRLADGLTAIDGVTVAHAVDVNMVFARWPPSVAEGLRERGFAFFDYDFSAEPLARLVTSHATTAESVDALVKAASELAPAVS